MKMDWKALGYQAKYQIINNEVTVIWENIDANSEQKCNEKRDNVI